MVLRWLVTLLVWARVLTVALREQKFAMEPQDQTAVVGSRVTLPCRVINKSGLLQWTKDGFGLGNLTGFDRYSIKGNTEDGEHSLEIFPLKLEDDALYRCQVGAGTEGEAPIISKVANLSVLIPPEPPRIVQGSNILTTEAREIQLECVSVGGRPPAEITWIDGTGNIQREGVEYITEILPDHKTYTARSVLKLVPRSEHHNSTFTCQAQNAADKTYCSATLKLQVKYAPKVNLITVLNRQSITEGQNVRFLCSTSANPPEVTYRWYIDEQVVLGDPTTELTLRNVSRKLHNSVVKCEVHNSVGKSQDSTTLNISYSPRFVMKPYSVQADVGSSITLTCEVDGNPPPNIVWIHEDSGRVVSTSPNLTLTVGHDTAGRYFCRATVPGFHDITAEATVYMKGPPTIISHRTQYGVPGDKVQVECSAFSIPTPQKVVWSFKGEDVGPDLDYSVKEDQLAEGIKSTLVISDSKHEHFGVYNCTVSNPYGSDIVEITLKPQKSFPLHSMLIGIMAGLGMIVALTMILLFCQRKGKKPRVSVAEPVKVAVPKESDLSSNLSELKLEIEYSGEEESDCDSYGGRPGLPLAGPVPLDHRYSQIYEDTNLPPAKDGRNNKGYVSYVDNGRDYTLPPGVSSIQAAEERAPVDPRYSAIYGNPYLRHTVGVPLPSPPPYAQLHEKSSRPPSLATHV